MSASTYADVDNSTSPTMDGLDEGDDDGGDRLTVGDSEEDRVEIGTVDGAEHTVRSTSADSDDGTRLVIAVDFGTTYTGESPNSLRT